MVWTYWIIAGIALVIVEILTPGSFFFACIGIGAIVAGLVAVAAGPTWRPWVVFAVASFLSIYFIRPLVRPFLRQGTTRSNVDELIGRSAVVTEPIEPPRFGMVKISGELWRAQSDIKAEVGSMVEVVSVEGTKLKVKKIER